MERKISLLRLSVIIGFLIILFSYIGTPLYAQTTVLSKQSASRIGKDAIVGVCIIDVESGQIAAQLNDEIFFTPASTQKLITAATLLLCYRPEQTLTTRLFYHGNISSRGRLSGDLVIKGCGDPSLGSEYRKETTDDFIKQAVEAVKKAGIHSISGRVIADEQTFDGNPIVSKWLWEDVGNYYAAGCYGINYADNRFNAVFRTGEPDSRPELIEIYPVVERLKLYNYLSTNRSNIDSAYFYGAPYEYSRRLYGSLPAHRNRFIIKGDLPDPPLFLAEQLTHALRQNGIKIKNEATTTRIEKEQQQRDFSSSTNCFVLVEYSSPTIIDMLRHTLIRSDNLYAEALLRQIALSTDSVSTLTNSIETMKQIWREAKFPLDGATLYDGSGLSPLNRITPSMMAHLLAYIARPTQQGQMFIDLLPHPGEGTLKRFMADSPLAPALRLKSGSMTGVQCYAGYYTAKHTYAVVIMVNHFTQQRNIIQQEIATTLTRILTSLE